MAPHGRFSSKIRDIRFQTPSPSKTNESNLLPVPGLARARDEKLPIPDMPTLLLNQYLIAEESGFVCFPLEHVVAELVASSLLFLRVAIFGCN